MTFKEWIELLERDYPYLDYGIVVSHNVFPGSFYGKHALQIEFVVDTGVFIEYDSTRHADGSKKEEGSQSGTAKAIEGKTKPSVQKRKCPCDERR